MAREHGGLALLNLQPWKDLGKRSDGLLAVPGGDPRPDLERPEDDVPALRPVSLKAGLLHPYPHAGEAKNRSDRIHCFRSVARGSGHRAYREQSEGGNEGQNE